LGNIVAEIIIGGSHMKRLSGVCVTAVAALLSTAQGQGPAQDPVQGPRGAYKARLSGYSEAPPVFTTASGEATAALNTAARTLEVTLQYAGLDAVQFAHLHFGQQNVNGNVIVFLCGGGGKPSCPQKEGALTVTIVPSDVQAIPVQGVTAGNWDALVQALENGAIYVNVHTARFVMGEIRGQLGHGFGPPAGRGRDKDENPGRGNRP
jgi:hypothetical protein